MCDVTSFRFSTRLQNNCEKRISFVASVSMYVCVCVCKVCLCVYVYVCTVCMFVCMEQVGTSWTDFREILYWHLLLKYVDQAQDVLNPTK